MASSSTHVEEATHDRSHPVEVTVNGQPVTLPDQEVTGLQIKEAAIAQGVQIGLNFELSVKRGNRYQIVGDTDRIRVHKGQEFLAVAPDDNS
jgi:UPF0288 family protein (methanogenesis marker protein 3)